MLKKTIPVMLAICLVFSVSAMAENQTDGSIPTEAPQEMPMQDGQMGTPPQMPNGERPQGGNRSGQAPQGEFTPPQNNEANNSENATPAMRQENNIPQNESNQAVNNTPENNTQNQDDTSEQNGQQNRQFPSGMQGGFPGEMQNNNQNAEASEPTSFIGFLKTYSTPITSVILLALAFVFVSFYKRRNY